MVIFHGYVSLPEGICPIFDVISRLIYPMMLVVCFTFLSMIRLDKKKLEGVVCFPKDDSSKKVI